MTPTLHTYAGDNADNIQLHLNQDLGNFHNWLRANKLTLNMTKTEFMLIRSRQSPRHLQLTIFKLARSPLQNDSW